MHHQLFSQACIHINTSVREGLPNSFIEAAGPQCAILSHVTPDDFASRFGYHAASNDFHQGLENLLSGNRWRDLGLDGYAYVKATYSLPFAMDAHEEVYQKIFRQKHKAR